jgi:hypothetical protein
MLTDAVASKYMYLMREAYTRYRYRAVNVFTGNFTLDVSSYREVRVKRRIPAASPFGFSAGAKLSNSQLAILAALGMSKFG